jgi:hypothetical protein
MNIYSSNGNFANSQLTSYNRIANLSKLNNQPLNGQEIPSGGSQSAAGCYLMNQSQNLKGKFYQTQVLQKVANDSGVGSQAESVSPGSGKVRGGSRGVGKNRSGATIDQAYT